MADVKQFSSDKILKHLDRVTEWMQGGNPTPITVELDMTNRCNNNCPHCVVGYFRTKNDDTLADDLADRIIRELGEIKVRGLIFTGGGEPLCHPYTLDAVQLACKCGLDVGFITNGLALNEEASEVLLQNCVWVRISLDAGTAPIYKITHGMNSQAFDKIVQNIHAIGQAKKRLDSKCTVGAGFLTWSETKDDMLAATKICRDAGIDYIQFRPLQIHDGGKFKYEFENVDKYVEKCQQFASDDFDVLYSKHKYDMMAREDYGRDYKKCYGHQFATTIGADAKVYLCCHLRHYDKYCLGDLTKSTFLEVWNSPERKKAYEGIDFKDCIPLCRDNTFNQVLWNLKQPRQHVNFL